MGKSPDLEVMLEDASSSSPSRGGNEKTLGYGGISLDGIDLENFSTPVVLNFPEIDFTDFSGFTFKISNTVQIDCLDNLFTWLH